MQSALDMTEDGRQRRALQEVREKEALAWKLQAEDEKMAEKAKTGDDHRATMLTSAAGASPPPKRWRDAEEMMTGVVKCGILQPNATADFRLAEARRCSWKNMDRTHVEGNLFLDDMKWLINDVSDMCISEDPTIKIVMGDTAYFEESTWGEVGSALGRGSRWVSALTYVGRRL